MAAELATSAVVKTVGNLTTEYASPSVSYFFRFGKIVEEFKNHRRELELKKNRVKNDVDEAIRQTEIIEEDVQNWLIRAEKELEEAQSLEAEIERKKCFNCCPSCGWRFCFSKKIAKKTLCINKLLESCNFPRVGYRAPLQGIEFLPSKDFMPYESLNSTFNEIIKALNNNGVNMIGLYGMPGVGKTTLAKEVGKHAKEQKLFDNVVMVTMNQTPNINKIQNKIAESLGLKFEASTEEGKAEELWRRLKGVKKILIIIDDVWNEFKLQIIGIPFGVEHEGCKILLTTRLQHVCVLMNCQEKFQLEILSEDEAWALFKDNAGLIDVSSTVNDVAKEVCYECMGLPLAIVTIGKALKGASLDGWTAANQRFKNSRHLDNEDVCEDIFKRLKLSYDHLKGDNIQLCFLLCSLFPEDCDIDIDFLLMFGIGHGLFSDIYSIEDLRREIREALRKLQESGLLLKIDDGDDEYEESDNDDDVDDDVYEEFDYDDDETYVMHDVVRDFAHWITSKEKNIFIVKEGLTEWPRSKSFGCCTAISFWNSNINNFPDKLEFPKLTIFVFTGKNLVRIPSEFVKGMKALRVLHLENVIFSLEVLKLVTKLQTLCFVDCELENISSLRNMENLEILELSDTNIYELPEELVALHRLKSLHFSYSGNQLQSNFPPNLLSRLASLQELHVTCENNLNLSELNSLSCLTALSLRVSTSQCFHENFVFPKLQRYMIAVNQDLRFMVGQKTLKISDFSSSLNAFKELFCNVEKLTLENVMEHKNIVPNVDQVGLIELTSLELRGCKDLECLMDTTGEKGPTTAFSNLVKLNMVEMTCFKQLFHGQPPIRFFQKLKEVIIEDCERLKVVFQMDGVLEKEEISQTPLLSNLTSLDLDSLPELESIWKLQPTHQYHGSLQSLKVVRIQNCNELKSIFSTFLAQSLLNLQELTISYCYKLEQVFDFPQEAAELEVPFSHLTSLKLEVLPELKCIWKGPSHYVCLQSLKVAEITHCKRLKYLFSPSLAQSLVLLEQLSIVCCDGLEHIIESDSGHVHLPLLPKLTSLEINRCSSLEYVFKIPLAQGLPHLKSVSISDAPQLKQIFNMAKEKNGVDHAIALPRLQHVNLYNLKNLSCFCSENYPIVSPSLEKLILMGCPRLESFPIQPDVNKQIQLEELRLFDLGNDKGCEKINCEKIFQIQAEHFLPRIEGPIQVASLHYLRELNVSKCNRLKSLFSCMLARNLPQLKILEISSCEELEEIIEIDHTSIASSSQGHLQPISFPSLEYIWIYMCNNLKSLFPISVIRSLSNLKSINIYGASKLEQVFGYQGELNVEDDEKGIMVLELNKFEFFELQTLKSFAPMGYHFRFPSLSCFKVEGCPNLITSFSKDSKDIVHAITKEPQQVEYNTTEVFTTMEEIVDNRPTSNDIFWNRKDCPDMLPSYINVEETEDNVTQRIEKQRETC